jgi:hypothetical protein
MDLSKKVLAFKIANPDKETALCGFFKEVEMEND